MGQASPTLDKREPFRKLAGLGRMGGAGSGLLTKLRDFSRPKNDKFNLGRVKSFEKSSRFPSAPYGFPNQPSSRPPFGPDSKAKASSSHDTSRNRGKHGLTTFSNGPLSPPRGRATSLSSVLKESGARRPGSREPGRAMSAPPGFPGIAATGIRKDRPGTGELGVKSGSGPRAHSSSGRLRPASYPPSLNDNPRANTDRRTKNRGKSNQAPPEHYTSAPSGLGRTLDPSAKHRPHDSEISKSGRKVGKSKFYIASPLKDPPAYADVHRPGRGRLENNARPGRKEKTQRPESRFVPPPQVPDKSPARIHGKGSSVQDSRAADVAAEKARASVELLPPRLPNKGPALRDSNKREKKMAKSAFTRERNSFPPQPLYPAPRLPQKGPALPESGKREKGAANSVLNPVRNSFPPDISRAQLAKLRLASAARPHAKPESLPGASTPAGMVRALLANSAGQKSPGPSDKRHPAPVPSHHAPAQSPASIDQANENGVSETPQIQSSAPLKPSRPAPPIPPQAAKARPNIPRRQRQRNKTPSRLSYEPQLPPIAEHGIEPDVGRQPSMPVGKDSKSGGGRERPQLKKNMAGKDFPASLLPSAKAEGDDEPMMPPMPKHAPTLATQVKSMQDKSFLSRDDIAPLDGIKGSQEKSIPPPPPPPPSGGIKGSQEKPVNPPPSPPPSYEEATRHPKFNQGKSPGLPLEGPALSKDVPKQNQPQQELARALMDQLKKFQTNPNPPPLAHQDAVWSKDVESSKAKSVPLLQK
ncbi:hypothetical protein CDD82_1027 [Ophiocordyceps australis]|uniref:Uncharacterized protein n=1 Tax=Ophiocordyceps australis TaxID=1399860 RepID=A0A2C5ZMU5_9HYPO|nr:hypothetical protein CDD82_1027 [Ophiocordyceps australis]